MNRDIRHHHRTGGSQSRNRCQTAAQDPQGQTACAAQHVDAFLHGSNQPFPVFFRPPSGDGSASDSSGFWYRLVLYACQIALSNGVFRLIFVQYAQAYAGFPRKNSQLGAPFWDRQDLSPSGSGLGIFNETVTVFRNSCFSLVQFAPVYSNSLQFCQFKITLHVFAGILCKQTKVTGL